MITQAHLLQELGEVEDREQLILLSELRRLLHSSSGVKEFDQMPAAWSELCESVAAGGVINGKNQQCQDVIGSWHQLLDRITTVMSRQVNNHVQIVMGRTEATDPNERLKKASAADR